MAAYEVLLLNTAIPQIQAAQSGDTYVVPRDIAFSAALTLSAGTANGVPYLNGSKVVTTGSALTFDGTSFKATGKIRANNAGVPTADVGFVTLNGYQGTSASNGGFAIAPTSGGGAEFYTHTGAVGAETYAERMRLDSSGNLGLGETNPTAISSGFTTMHIKGSNGGGIRCGTTSQFYVYSDSTNAFLNQTSNGYMSFATNNTERARITSGGNFLVGTDNSAGNAGVGAKLLSTGRIFSVVSTNDGTESYSLYSTGAAAYRFYVTDTGTVYATNTTISAISDHRFKENIRDLDVGLDAILALKPRKFDWKVGKGKNKKDDRGFIAQEFEQVFPDLIDNWKDPAPEGEEPYKSVRQDLIPVLVKAIQEQQAMINELKAEVAALKGA